MAQLMSLPLTVSCFSKIQIGLPYLVPAHLGSPGKRAVKRVCVCVCVATSSVIDIVCILCGAASMKWDSVCPSVCLSQHGPTAANDDSSKPTAAGLLLWAQWAGDVDRLRVHAGSAVLSA